MSVIFDSISEWHQKLSVGTSPDIDKIWLYSSPINVIVIIVAYMSFVFHYGPKWMKNREPMNLKYLILFYNLLQVYYNAWMVQELLRIPNIWTFISQFGSTEGIPDEDLPPLFAEVSRCFWHYTYNKIFDLLDTVFFVLAKKQSHVTFLHVHHHSLMVGALWVIGKYWPGFDGVIIGLCNTIVHTVMYFYYFIAALGPEFKKYLWWKNYLTIMQIVQFGIIIIYSAVSQFLFGSFNVYLIMFIMAEAAFNFYLFSSFYVKTYVKKSKKSQ